MALGGATKVAASPSPAAATRAEEGEDGTGEEAGGGRRYAAVVAIVPLVAVGACKFRRAASLVARCVCVARVCPRCVGVARAI